MRSLGVYVKRLLRFSMNARLWLLSAVFAGLGWSVSNVLFPLYLLKLGYREDLIGTFSSVSALMIGITAIPAGLLLRNRGKKMPLVIASASGAVSGLIQIAIPERALLIATNAAHGVFFTLLLVTELPFLMENSEPDERSHLFSINFVAFFSMFVIGSLVAGQLPRLAGGLMRANPESLAVFRASLFSGIVLRVASVIPLVFIREKGPAESEPQSTHGLPRLPSARAIMKLSSARVAFAVGSGLFMPFVPVLLRAVLGAGTQTIGTITALTNAAVTVGCLFAPLLERKFGIVPSIALSVLLSAPLVVVAGISRVLPIVAWAVVLREMAAMSTAPLRQRLSMEVVTKEERSIVASIDQVAWQAPWALGAWLGGHMIRLHGYALVFSVAALFYAASGLIYALAFRQESARLRAATPE